MEGNLLHWREGNFTSRLQRVKHMKHETGGRPETLATDKRDSQWMYHSQGVAVAITAQVTQESGAPPPHEDNMATGVTNGFLFTL